MLLKCCRAGCILPMLHLASNVGVDTGHFMATLGAFAPFRIAAGAPLSHSGSGACLAKALLLVLSDTSSYRDLSKE